MGKLERESRYDEIRETVADFIEDYGIRLYPFSILSLLNRMGIKVVPYSSLCRENRNLIEFQYPEAVTRHKGIVYRMRDGSIVSHRYISSSEDGSPVVELKVKNASGVKSQKIHFIKKGK